MGQPPEPEGRHRRADGTASQEQPDGQQQRGNRGITPAPPPGHAKKADAAGQDGFAAEDAVQVVGQRLGRRIARVRLLLEAFQADRFQVERQPALQPTGRHRVLKTHLLERIDRGRAPKRRAAGQQLVKDRTERIYVRRRPHFVRFSLGLLGRHVRRRAQDRARGGQVARLQLGQTEVGDLGRVVRGEQDVRRLQVPVDDAQPMSRLDGPGKLLDQAGRLVRQQRRTVEALSEAPAADVLERQERQPVVFPDLMDLDDVRMAHSCDGVGFSQKACAALGVGVRARQKHLERHVAGRVRLPGAVDDARAAPPQFFEDLIRLYP